MLRQGCAGCRVWTSKDAVNSKAQLRGPADPYRERILAENERLLARDSGFSQLHSATSIHRRSILPLICSTSSRISIWSHSSES